MPGIDGHRVMVPKALVGTLMKGVHDNNGHQGVDRVTARINLKFNWTGKYRDVRSHIRSCEVCKMCKLGDWKVEMGRLRTDKLLDLVCIDFLKVDKSTDGR